MRASRIVGRATRDSGKRTIELNHQDSIHRFAWGPSFGNVWVDLLPFGRASVCLAEFSETVAPRRGSSLIQLESVRTGEPPANGSKLRNRGGLPNESRADPR